MHKIFKEYNWGLKDKPSFIVKEGGKTKVKTKSRERRVSRMPTGKLPG